MPQAFALVATGPTRGGRAVIVQDPLGSARSRSIHAAGLSVDLSSSGPTRTTSRVTGIQRTVCRRASSTPRRRELKAMYTPTHARRRITPRSARELKNHHEGYEGREQVGGMARNKREHFLVPRKRVRSASSSRALGGSIASGHREGALRAAHCSLSDYLEEAADKYRNPERRLSRRLPDPTTDRTQNGSFTTATSLLKLRNPKTTSSSHGRAHNRYRSQQSQTQRSTALVQSGINLANATLEVPRASRRCDMVGANLEGAKLHNAT